MATAEHLELEVTGVQVRVEKPSVSYKTKDNQNRPLSSSRVSKKNCCTCSKTCLFGIIQLLILATSLSALAISIAALQRPGVARLVQQDEGFTENSRMEANALNQVCCMHLCWSVWHIVHIMLWIAMHPMRKNNYDYSFCSWRACWRRWVKWGSSTLMSELSYMIPLKREV